MGRLTNFSKSLVHAWNSFQSDELDYRPAVPMGSYGPTYSVRPDRQTVRVGSERTIISSIYTRMSVDVAAVRIEHVRVDENEQYVETLKSGINDCLRVEANVDQAGRHFRQDMALTLFREGCIAIVPVDTTNDPRFSDNWDVRSLRVGTILDWAPNDVKVRVYNERKGIQQDIWIPKRMVAIVENPFYSVMNEPNSTLQRLIRKLALLDNVDEISSSGKLDIIIQLPYVVKTDSRKQQAEKRRDELEQQLKGSTYGIAYADGTEKITQLNRSVENNLLTQVQYLKGELYNELGLTESIMNGTATDVEMLNYTNRVIEPVMDAITEAIIRTFLSKTARSQGQTIMYFQSPFKLLPISELANIADVLSRNQIVTPNEFRPVLGLKPSREPQANKLVNSNMPLNQQITGDNTDPAALPPADPQSTDATAPDPQAQLDRNEAKLNKQMAELGL